MHIYIAGPYGRSEKNVQKAIKVAREVIKRGHKPYIPHLLHYVADGWKDSPNEEAWYYIGSEIMLGCDAILMMKGWEKSKGATRERQMARLLTLKIYYSIDEIPKGVGYGSN